MVEFHALLNFVWFIYIIYHLGLGRGSYSNFLLQRHRVGSTHYHGQLQQIPQQMSSVFSHISTIFFYLLISTNTNNTILQNYSFKWNLLIFNISRSTPSPLLTSQRLLRLGFSRRRNQHLWWIRRVFCPRLHGPRKWCFYWKSCQIR